MIHNYFHDLNVISHWSCKYIVNECVYEQLNGTSSHALSLFKLFIEYKCTIGFFVVCFIVFLFSYYFYRENIYNKIPTLKWSNRLCGSNDDKQKKNFWMKIMNWKGTVS